MVPLVPTDIPSPQSVPMFAGIYISDGGYANAVAADTPLGWWKLNEMSGTTAADSGSGGNAGTYTAGYSQMQVGPVIDGISYATKLDGSTGFINIGDIAAFRFTGAFSVEAWIKTIGVGNALVPVVAKCLHDLSTGGWAICQNTNAIRVLVYTAAGAPIIDFSGIKAINDGAWHHVVVTWDGTTSANHAIIYVDGVSDQTGTAVAGTVGTPAQSLRIGSFADAGGTFFGYNGTAGNIGEVALYTSVLSATRIAAHYAAGPSRLLIETGNGQVQPIVNAKPGIVYPFQCRRVANAGTNAVGVIGFEG